MTDNEIIKALEQCSLPTGCKECPCFPNGPCITNKDALSLINRQKAEIERLGKQLVFEIESAYDRGAKTATKEFAERVKRYIDVGHLRPPTEKCFSELDVVSVIDNLVKEKMGEDNNSLLVDNQK